MYTLWKLGNTSKSESIITRFFVSSFLKIKQNFEEIFGRTAKKKKKGRKGGMEIDALFAFRK